MTVMMTVERAMTMMFCVCGNNSTGEHDDGEKGK
jgi:hypothetical protein